MNNFNGMYKIIFTSGSSNNKNKAQPQINRKRQLCETTQSPEKSHQAANLIARSLDSVMNATSNLHGTYTATVLARACVCVCVCFGKRMQIELLFAVDIFHGFFICSGVCVFGLVRTNHRAAIRSPENGGCGRSTLVGEPITVEQKT